MNGKIKMAEGRLSGAREWRFQDGRDGSILRVSIKPHCAETCIHAIQHNAVVEIHLQSEDNPWRSNQELVTYLSRLLQIPESCIEIVAGLYSRNKVVALEGVSPGEVTERLHSELKRRQPLAS